MGKAGGGVCLGEDPDFKIRMGGLNMISKEIIRVRYACIDHAEITSLWVSPAGTIYIGFSRGSYDTGAGASVFDKIMKDTRPIDVGVSTEAYLKANDHIFKKVWARTTTSKFAWE